MPFVRGGGVRDLEAIDPRQRLDEGGGAPLDPLHECEALLSAVIDGAPIAIGVRRVRGDDLVHVRDNRNLAALFGQTPEALMGKSDLELGTAPEMVKNAIALSRLARDSGRAIRVELAFPSPLGVRRMHCRLVSLPPMADGAERFCVMAEDVTELRTLESQIVHAERLAALGTLAASVGHEIRNPASYILLMLDSALAKTRDPSGVLSEARIEEIRELLRVASEGVSRIAKLVGELQRLAQPEPEGPSSCDVNTVVSDALRLAQSDLAAAATIEVSLGALPRARGSDLRLAQVMLNLLRNAALAVEKTPSPRIAVSTSASASGGARVEVRDNGSGVDPAVRKRLFEPFTTTRERGQGSGLGLFVSRRIVQSFGGTLDLTDAPDGGTIAVIELPAARASSPPA